MLRNHAINAESTARHRYFWLQKLNQFNGDFVQAEMVKAFISSIG